MDIKRVKDDFKYIIMNCIINRVPCWKIRRFFLRKCGLKISDSARIGIGCVVIHPEKISIGDRTVINEYCHLDGRGGVIIGNDVSISIYTKLITASHRMKSENFAYYDSKTVIGNNVWVGTGAIILDGSQIADRSVIGAGAVFKGSTNEQEVYVGNPAILVKKRELPNNYELRYTCYFR